MFQRMRRGASALEFALVLVVLVPLVVTSIEFGWYMALRIMVEHCTRDAVRAAVDICSPDNCDMLLGGECQACLNPLGTNPTTVATDTFSQCWTGGGYPGTATATVTRSGSAASFDRRMTVVGSVTYTPIATATLLPNPIRTSLTMRFDDQSF